MGIVRAFSETTMLKNAGAISNNPCVLEICLEKHGTHDNKNTIHDH
jgi:hypothetical protein